MRKRERDNGFEEWGGYMAAKMSKLEDQFSTEAKNFDLKESNLFEGISIFVNGYTMPPAYELRNLMMKHGGSFHHYHRPDKTTYVVASNLPDSKLKQVNKLIVIKPEWIIDCIKVGKLLNYKDYLLYTNQSKNQPLLDFNAKKKTEGRSPTKTAKDDQFLSEFYNNSRLHLISTLGATFKRYVNELRSQIKDYPGRDFLKSRMKPDEHIDQEKIVGWGTVIMHIDMDCFFVSVSIRQRPDLIGQPVAVTHSKGNQPSARPGVDMQAEYKAYHGSKSSNPNHWSNAGQSFSMAEIASCSYEARKAGVKNGMFMGQALNLCPNLVTLPYDFDGYKDVAKVLYDTVARYTLSIEAVSCDEMFVDCTELLSSVSMTPLEFAAHIRTEIKEKTQCPCSTGFGSNKLQARLATRKAKPDGQFFLEPDMVSDFMSSVPVSDLPGVGRAITCKLKSMGITSCSELQEKSLMSLKHDFGEKTGDTLYNYAFGRDSKALTFEKIRKSVSAEVNYGIRFQMNSERDKFLKQLSEEVANRLTEISMKGKSITLKIMVKSKDAPQETAKFLGHGVCDYFTKTNSIRSHTDDPSVIFREVTAIMSQFNVPSKDLRGVGIQMSKLISDRCAKSNLNKFFAPKINENKKKNEGEISKAMDNDSVQPSISNCLPDTEVGNKFDSISNKNIKDSTVNNENVEKINNINIPGTSKDGPKNKVIKDSRTPWNVTRKNNFVQPDLETLSISQIDPSFLDALPDDLRNEILGAVKKKDLKVETEKYTNCINNENTTERCKVYTVETENTEELASDSLSCQVSPEAMRSFIKEWVSSSYSPLQCDAQMFAEYLTTLVTSRQIDHLHTLLKIFLRELTKNNKSPEWSACFNATLEEVQLRMLAVYGAKLTRIL